MCFRIERESERRNIATQNEKRKCWLLLPIQNDSIMEGRRERRKGRKEIIESGKFQRKAKMGERGGGGGL